VCSVLAATIEECVKEEEEEKEEKEEERTWLFAARA
jgi:hypothetical protein